MITKFFDTETTDIIISFLRPLKKQPHVWWYYSIDEEDNELDLLIDPIEELSKGASKTTKKVRKDLIGNPTFDQVAEQIKKDIESSDLMVAHNITFDRDVLNFEFQRLGMKVDWPSLLCTVESTEFLLGYRLNLTALHEHLFGCKFDGAHGARDDVLALRNCYRELVKRELI